MKCKVGDTVTIKEDLQERDGDRYEKVVSIAWEMLNYRGRTAKIVDIFENYYHISIDRNDWIWQDDMFKEVIRETIEIKSIPNILSYTLDTQYSCYIKSQNVSSEEKMAVKKFIEFARKNMKDSVDKNINNIKIIE